jgi:hypothetical protein
MTNSSMIQWFERITYTYILELLDLDGSHIEAEHNQISFGNMITRLLRKAFFIPSLMEENCTSFTSQGYDVTAMPHLTWTRSTTKNIQL